MKSIREIYKTGKGPSSSHTMRPERAARQIGYLPVASFGGGDIRIPGQSHRDTLKAYCPVA